MYRLCYLLTLGSLLLFSCNNDDGNSTPENEPVNFYALEVGNTWEYEVSRYSISNETYEPVDLTITNTISGSSEINGETFYTYTATFVGSHECDFCLDDIGNKTVRDSLGYLINEQGSIIFSNTTTDDYLLSSAPWGSVYGKYVSNNVNVNTPAGDFEAYQNDRYAVLADGETAPGMDSHLISEGIGTVQKSIAVVNSENPLYIMTPKILFFGRLRIVVFRNTFSL